MSDESGEEQKDIAPSFEEQIRFLRKSRGLKGTLFQKTTEHNVTKKLVRELDTKSRRHIEAKLDKRLDETLNREMSLDVFCLMDSLTASLTGYTRRSTKNFKSSVASNEPTGENSDQSTKNSVAPRMVARATKQYQVYTSADGQQSIQAPPHVKQLETKHNSEDMVLGQAKEILAPSRDDADMVLGKARPEPHAEKASPAQDLDKGPKKNETSGTANSTSTKPSHIEAAESGASTAEALAERTSASPVMESATKAFQLSTEFIQEMAVFTAQTGLDLIVNSENRLDVFLTACGETKQIYEVSLDLDGLTEAYMLFEQLSKHYMRSLGDDFGIEFGHPGEIAIHQTQRNGKKAPLQTKPLFIRLPRLDELKAVHAALEFSWPASAQPDDQPPMRFLFVNDVLIKGTEDGVRLKFMEDGRPVLFVTPVLCLSGGPTERDTSGEGVESWQSQIMRELSWKTLAECAKLPVSAEDCQTLGWLEIKNSNGLYVFLGKDNSYYYPHPDPSSEQEAWIKVNSAGEYLNTDGKPISNIGQIIYLSAEQVKELALVTPPGEFFHSPEEELADVLCRYRTGQAERAAILKGSPSIYRLAKAVDQACINRWYIPTKTYSGLLRSPASALVDNNSENQREVLDFELAQRK